jgi:hypothetical protein
MSDLNPYRDYEPERARWQAMYLAAFVGLIVVLAGLVYLGAQRANVASNTAIEAPQVPMPSAAQGSAARSTTGSNPSSR